MAETTVYLAGPMVFYRDPAPTFAAMKRLCAEHGLIGVSPLDNQTMLQGLRPGHALAMSIVKADIALMQGLDAGVFCFDSFRRSPEMDPGTAFEIGYMHALGKPLAGWTSDPRDYPARVHDYFSDRHHTDLSHSVSVQANGQSGVLRDEDGILIHSEGCYQNAMTQIGIELSGGRVFADQNWTKAFEAAIISLVRSVQPSRNRRRALA